MLCLLYFGLTYEAIVRDQVRSLLLGFALDGAKGCWKTRRCQTVDVRLMVSFLFQIDNGQSLVTFLRFVCKAIQSLLVGSDLQS